MSPEKKLDAIRNPNQSLLGELSKAVDDAICRHVPTGSEVALVGFPDYWNAGDSAIWLGACESLRRNRNRVIFACGAHNYDPEAARNGIKDRPVLINGGGNLGDIWDGEQRFRESLIRDFRPNRIIQLPQTIHFTSQASLDQFRSICEMHADLTILVRDQRSLGFATDHLPAKVELVPDLSLALGLIGREVPAKYSLLWLLRQDEESSQQISSPSKSESQYATDWAHLKRHELRMFYLSIKCKQRIRYAATQFAMGNQTTTDIQSLVNGYEDLARLRLARGLKILQLGQSVITDRLHGHLLSLLLGIPHILLDNNYGKVFETHATWTAQSTQVKTSVTSVESLQAAVDELRNIDT